jgi:serine/threonine protein kinase
MAPEQLAGKPASIRSDIYALGLVLFEIFTGRRAHDAKSLGDLEQLHDAGTLTTPPPTRPSGWGRTWPTCSGRRAPIAIRDAGTR